MLDDIDLGSLDPALLACQDKLDPAHPVTITAKETIKLLAEIGIKTDGLMPGGLRDYIAAVFKACALKPSSESLRAILQKPEVQLTLFSAVDAAKKVAEAENADSIDISDKLKNSSNLDETSIASLKQAMTQVEKNKIKEIVQETPLMPNNNDTKAVDEPIDAVDSAKPQTIDTLPYCPRCHWDLQTEYKYETFTEADKAHFLYCLLGETAFEKTFSLLDGKLKVTFRALTPDEENAIYAQLRRDSRDDKVIDINHLSHAQFEYEFATALKDISPNSYGIKPEYTDFTGEDAIKDYCAKINNVVIKTTARKRLLIEMFQKFQATYKDLLDEVLDENFYHPAN